MWDSTNWYRSLGNLNAILWLAIKQGQTLLLLMVQNKTEGDHRFNKTYLIYPLVTATTKLQQGFEKLSILEFTVSSDHLSPSNSGVTSTAQA